jgi:hypothetical protein
MRKENRKNKNDFYMDFGISEDESTRWGYGNSQARDIKPMKYKKFIKTLTKAINETGECFLKKPYSKYAFITGRVKKGGCFLLPDKYLMLLDVDGEKEKEQVMERLNIQNIEHFVIQSSPGKYWIVGNKLASVKNHVKEMMTIPEVDQNYVKCSNNQDALLFRAFPKPGFTPKFGDMSKLDRDTLYGKWIFRFKEYWESKAVIKMSEALFAEAI